MRRKSTTSTTRKAQRRNATKLYLGGVSLLLLFGVGAEVAGHLLFDDKAVWYALLTGLGEALLISAVLATLVDPYLKRRMQTESAWGGVFGFLNDQAPEGLKDAIKDLAGVKVYYPSTIWTLTFEWKDRPNDILGLKLDVQSVGLNISRHPYVLNRKAWILASTTGHDSEYLRYAVNCPGEIDAIDAQGRLIRQHMTILEDGSVTVDEAGLSKGQAIPPGKAFDTIKSAKMYRHSTGYIPLYHGKFGENLEIRLGGPAMEDIDVRVSHPTFDGRTHLTERRRAAASTPEPVTARFARMVPGQITIVSWRPAAHETSPRRIDLPAPAPDSEAGDNHPM